MVNHFLMVNHFFSNFRTLANKWSLSASDWGESCDSSPIHMCTSNPQFIHSQATMAQHHSLHATSMTVILFQPLPYKQVASFNRLVQQLNYNRFSLILTVGILTVEPNVGWHSLFSLKWGFKYLHKYQIVHFSGMKTSLSTMVSIRAEVWQPLIGLEQKDNDEKV